MKKSIIILSTAGIIASLVACHKSIPTPSGTVYLDLPATTDHYFSNGSTGSETVDAKATLGRVLFYDGHLSVNNAISCGSCHKQSAAFADDVQFSTGYESRKTVRNSKNITNLLGNNNGFFSASLLQEPFQALFWDGREDVLQNLSAKPITNHIEMGMDDPDKIPAKLALLPYYTSLFNQAYGDNSITYDRISECLSVFMAAINSDNSRFDQAQNGGASLTDQELHGESLFISKYNCASCHHVFVNVYGAQDSTSFRDIGLDATPTDAGRGAITLNPSDNGKFRVPNLHNVALSAPYMHDGRYQTLEQVIDHYSHTIQASRNLDPLLKDPNNPSQPLSMNITDQDKADLIAFLKTMTDYQMVTDPKFSNPFKTK